MSRLKMSVRLSGGPPWGFRLEGKTPEHPNLNVSKVRAKSKAYNILKEGDFVICINGIPAKDMTFDQAMDMLDAPSLDLTLDLLRVKQISGENYYEGTPSETQQVEAKIDKKMEEKEAFDKEIRERVKLQAEKNQQSQEMSKEIRDNVCESDENESDNVSSDEEEDEEEDDIQPQLLSSAPKEQAPSQEQPVEPPQAHPASEESEEDEEESEYEEEEDADEGDGEEDEEEETRDTEKGHLESRKLEFPEQKMREEEAGQDSLASSARSEIKTADAASAAATASAATGEGKSVWGALGVRPGAVTAAPNRLPTPFGASPTVGRVGGGWKAFGVGAGAEEEGKHVEIQCQPPPPSRQHSDSSANLHRGHNGSLGDEQQLNGEREHQTEPEMEERADTHPLFKVAKIVGRSQTWTPSTGYTRPSQIISDQQTDVWKRLKSGSGSSSRPKSMPVAPEIHFYHSPQPEEVRYNRAQSEEKEYTKVVNGHRAIPSSPNLLRKLTQPPEEMEDLDLLLSKKKMFSSSSFYEEPTHIYPTVEEQVELCRKIANSLSSDTNQLSKGATMYNKRKKRADKWCFEGPDPSDNEGGTDYNSSPDISNSVQSSYRSTETHRKLKLVLDPRQLVDSNRLRHLGLYNEHNLISPEICFDLVKDLNSPTGKGAALFAKRKKKSEKWVVDENSVKKSELQHERIENNLNNLFNQQQHQHQPPPQSHLEAYEQMMSHRRLKLIKSPWEAALESPIGSCDAAFQEVTYRETFQPKLNGQIKKEYTVPISVNNQGVSLEAPPISLSASPISTDTSHVGSRTFSPNLGRFSAASSSEVYKPRAPKGWGGQTTDYSSTNNWAQEAPVYSELNSSLDGTPFSPNINFDLTQCKDFNNTARSFNTGLCRGGGSFRSVRPPSLVFS